MGVPYAEVIGDPIAHSKSPLIHKYWLERLAMAGDYRAALVPAGGLRTYLVARRADPWWRGCNVTAPLKAEAAACVGAPAGLCDGVGAVNIISRTSLGCLIGTNSDLNGIEEALAGGDIAGASVSVIGAGGAARALLCYLGTAGVGPIRLAARDPGRAASLAALLPGRIAVTPFDAPVIGNIVVNATPLGTTGGPPLPPALLAAITATRPRLAFDMVYAPTDTLFLQTARAAGARTVNGLAMLIGQAAPAFEYFFGRLAPRQHDAELRRLIA